MKNSKLANVNNKSSNFLIGYQQNLFPNNYSEKA